MSEFYIDTNDMNINDVNKMLGELNLFNQEWIDDKWDDVCKNTKTKKSNVSVHDMNVDELLVATAPPTKYASKPLSVIVFITS